MSSAIDGADPRLGLRPGDALPLDGGDPVVGRPPGRSNAVLTVSVFAALAVGLFVLLNANRTSSATASLVTPTATPSAGSAPPPPLQTAPPTPPAVTPPPPVPLMFGAPAAPPALPPPVATRAGDGVQRRRAPAMVVDLGATENTTAPVAAGSDATSGSAANVAAASSGGLASGAQTGSSIGGDEQFAERIGDQRPDRSRAIAMRNLDTLVPQGATILAVLETAIDSDLPGYTRAVVSRDVLSFDGKSVLIPRGSRVIGQYKSAVSLGASRAFVIWTRVIRPDGVSIQIGSPGADALGRGGLAGDVNRHFFQRFGGSILLSVLSAGIASVSHNPTTTIAIGSPGAAMGAASSIQGDAISPTIRVAQGAVINIFVARDLDFSGVGPVQ